MLSTIFHRFRLPRLVRQLTNIAIDNKKYKQSTEKTIRDQHLANIRVTSFYSQSAIEQLALKQSTRISPLTMMHIGRTKDDEHLLRSAQYLHQDLPIRLAHRINDFRNLPFVVACNPRLLELHERFIKIFHTLHSFPPIKTLEQEKIFTELLQNIFNYSSDTIPLLAEGFRESQRHINQEMFVRNFLDRILTSRLAIQMLIEHHIELRKDKVNHIGAICMNFSPKKFIESSAEYVQKVYRSTYGIAPNVQIDGHVNSSFPYITTPLYYIVPEMLKNAFRATVEYHKNSDHDVPNVDVTISVNEDELLLRIRDRGGGMSQSLLDKIFDYNFSSNNSGVPISRAYCEYLNGSLVFETLFGVGTDVYIRLGLLTSENRIIRL